ncbi:MAG: hypothetical protein NC489_21355 [Ruminococcus flavefaciens]|nr:hypothetical protein [Ruminococcus flavefaciens]
MDGNGWSEARELRKEVERLQRKLDKRKRNNLVYICSPYRGDITRNTEYARELTRIALDNGYTPITPHLYLTQVLNEEDPAQRERGMAAGAELLKHCKYIFIGSRYGISEGMLSEIQIALETGITELAQEKGGLVEVYGGQQA